MKLSIKRIELSQNGFLEAVEFETPPTVSADEIAEYVQELRYSIAMKHYSYKKEAADE